MFEVSFHTERRDLRKTEEKGLLKRTHGGSPSSSSRLFKTS
ncbi:MAG: DeoR family transcriptional regulator [Clostridiales bacterium]|nr:DeoR family transcriptional regulator [Clostridiales bacterium]